MEYSHLLVIAAALGAGGFTKGATGMGLPLVAMPVLASYLGLQHAVSVIVVPTIATNLWQVWRLRAEHSSGDMRFVTRMSVAGAIGTVLGTYALVLLDQRTLLLFLGVVLLVYTAFRLLQPNFVLGPELGRKTSPASGLAAGLLQGAAGLSSPAVVTFIHAMRLPYRPHVYAVSVVFLVLAVMHVPALAVTGVLRWQWLAEGAFALLPAVALMPLGQKVGAAFSRQTFDRLLLAFIAFMGVKLVLGF